MPEQKPKCRGCKKPVDRDAPDALKRQFTKERSPIDKHETVTRTEWWHRPCFDEKYPPPPEGDPPDTRTPEEMLNRLVED